MKVYNEKYFNKYLGKPVRVKQYYKGGKLRADITFKNGKVKRGYLYTYEGKKSNMTNAHYSNLGFDYD